MVDLLSHFRRPKRISAEDYMKKLIERNLDESGMINPDGTPMAPPIGYKKQPSMIELVREQIRSHHLATELAAQGAETFEESEDFDVPDEPEQLHSEWENDFDPPIQEIAKEVTASRTPPPPAPSPVGGGGGGSPPPVAPPAPAQPVPPAKPVEPPAT